MVARISGPYDRATAQYGKNNGNSPLPALSDQVVSKLESVGQRDACRCQRFCCYNVSPYGQLPH